MWSKITEYLSKKPLRPNRSPDCTSERAVDSSSPGGQSWAAFLRGCQDVRRVQVPERS